MEPKVEIVHITTPVAKYTLDYNTGAIKAKPIVTNADRIRSMMDEELAEKIGGSIDCEVCKTMHHSENDECPSRPHQHCVDFWLDWLKAEGEG